MMKLHVKQSERYAFDIPPDQEAEVRADPDGYFTNLHNPVAEAETYEATERRFEFETDAPTLPFHCPNCEWGGIETELKNHFPNIPDLLQRIAPGEPVPTGECPKCGALCHPTKP